ncbi:ABC transporter permease [Sinomicrobium kalidii]|uniref:ABC transporter permease n=1 Tax=Sinomicrobium kalidii TaxID=2900738 RepID=UPI001E3C70EE|nr:ABC transporter permease [Sinomicrobium kalidii]UGU15796.1 ABC transporter permease [Sinomicrobium kalidii]
MKTPLHLDIRTLLPHRAPFLMIDNILSLTDVDVTTSFRIQKDCIFNDNGTFNETGLIENAAQTCSAIVGQRYFKNGKLINRKTRLIGFISTIKNVTVNTCPEVGRTIVSNATLKSRSDTGQYCLCSMECVVRESNRELLSCEMNLIIQELSV